MRSANCIPKQGSSPTQPPQALHQPGLTDGLSPTACFQISAQLQSQTLGPLTIMGSCQSPQLLHSTWPGRMGNATQLVTHPAFKNDSSDPSLHASVPTQRSFQQGSQVGPAEGSHSGRC